jgi:hypothetical protein
MSAIYTTALPDSRESGWPPRRTPDRDIPCRTGLQEMRMLFKILGFPVSGPLKTVGWIGGAIRDAVDSKMNDPTEIKRALAALEQQLDAGALSEQQYELMEMELIKRLQGAASRPPHAGTGSGG